MARTKRRWQERELQLVRRMRIAGATADEIGKAIGSSGDMVKRRFADLFREVREATDGDTHTPPATLFSDQERELVKNMSIYGMPQRDIARMFHMSEETLRQNFAEELLEGDTEAKGELVKTAYHLAVRERNPTMVIFLLKTRCGYHYQQHFVMQGDASKPVAVDHTLRLDAEQVINGLSDDALLGIEVYLAALGARSKMAPITIPAAATTIEETPDGDSAVH